MENRNAGAPRGCWLTAPNPEKPMMPMTATTLNIYFLSNRSQAQPTSGAPSKATNCDVPVNAAANAYAFRQPLIDQPCRREGRYLLDFLGRCMRVDCTQALLDEKVIYNGRYE